MGLTGAPGPMGPTGPTGPAGMDVDMARIEALEATLEDADYCPRLLTRERTLRAYAPDLTLPDVVICRAGPDEMVKVGDFWIDRYEASVEPNSGALGSGPAHDTTARATSRTGVAPQSNLTWFQAAALCANAGKHLCTNGEWQAAVSGTVDPGASPGIGQAPITGPCNTLSTGHRNTGRAGSPTTPNCISRHGAEDMIGNAGEWVDLWGQAGRDMNSTQGQQRNTAWPAGYGGDGIWNINGEAFQGGGWTTGAPSAAIRGLDSTNGAAAGAFALALSHSPASAAAEYGFRCCAGGR